MSDIGQVAGAIKSVADLLKPLVEEGLAQRYDKEYHESIVTIQNAFAENSLDSDAFRIFIDRMCNEAAHPLTPTGDIKLGRRELLHSLLLIAAEAIRDRKYINSYTYSLRNK